MTKDRDEEHDDLDAARGIIYPVLICIIVVWIPIFLFWWHKYQ
jgi:hypothetical protein